jgi:hypothetical protein
MSSSAVDSSGKIAAKLWNARRYCRSESTSCHMEGFEWFDIVRGLRKLRVGRLGREKKNPTIVWFNAMRKQEPKALGSDPRSRLEQ